MSDDKKYTVFVDSLGRTVVAELVGDTKTTLEAKNPAVLHVQPDPNTGQIQVQLIPYFFKEFAKKEGSDATWLFLKSNVTLSKGLELDDRLVQQYHNMYSPIQTPSTPGLVGAGAPATDTPVVKLFDD